MTPLNKKRLLNDPCCNISFLCQSEFAEVSFLGKLSNPTATCPRMQHRNTELNYIYIYNISSTKVIFVQSYYSTNFDQNWLCGPMPMIKLFPLQLPQNSTISHRNRRQRIDVCTTVLYRPCAAQNGIVKDMFSSVEGDRARRGRTWKQKEAAVSDALDKALHMPAVRPTFIAR